MAVDKETLKHYIQEQRRYHDELTSSYQSLRTKIITYIGAVLALFAFLYAGALDAAKTTQQRLFIPNELYGKIFYYFGLFLVLYALGKLVHGARPNGSWGVAMDSNDARVIESMTEEEYLIKLKDDHEKMRRYNLDQHEQKLVAIKDSFYPLLLGAIILIALRYFQ
jgi:hypothetical protein